MVDIYSQLDTESLRALLEVDVLEREEWRARQSALAENYSAGGVRRPPSCVAVLAVIVIFVVVFSCAALTLVTVFGPVGRGVAY
jgi:hypothetical protein